MLNIFGCRVGVVGPRQKSPTHKWENSGTGLTLDHDPVLADVPTESKRGVQDFPSLICISVYKMPPCSQHRDPRKRSRLVGVVDCGVSNVSTWHEQCVWLWCPTQPCIECKIVVSDPRNERRKWFIPVSIYQFVIRFPVFVLTGKFHEKVECLSIFNEGIFFVGDCHAAEGFDVEWLVNLREA